MGLGKSRGALWLLIYRKVPVKILLKLGFQKSMVYRYAAEYPEVEKEFREKFREFKRLKELKGAE